MPRIFALGLVALLSAELLGACAAQPRVRPVKGDDVDIGTGTVESDRRRLEGAWRLATFDVVDANGGRTRVNAEARLKYDEFGNLELTGRVLDAPGGIAPTRNYVSYKGRAVLDTNLHQIRLLDSSGSALQDSVVSDLVNVDAVRRYSFEGDQLRMELANAAGRTTAIAIWQRET